jgi:hypothetical protein
MNKEKLFRLREMVNELFFKKNYQRGKSSRRKEYLVISLSGGPNLQIKILATI